MPGLLDDLRRELADAWELDRIVHGIRVTDVAIPGSVVALPISPELARLVALTAGDPDGGVPAEVTEVLEILVHPDDWSALLKDLEAIDAVTLGTPTRVMGVPLREASILRTTPQEARSAAARARRADGQPHDDFALDVMRGMDALRRSYYGIPDDMATCPCGDEACMYFEFGYPFCAGCGDHHRLPVAVGEGECCPVDVHADQADE